MGLALRSMIDSLFPILVVAALVVPVFAAKKLSSLVVVSAYAVLLFVARLMSQRGRELAAARLFVVGLWVFYTVHMVLAGGIDTVVSAFYVTTPVFAGLLLGRRAAIMSTAVCLMASLGLLLAQTNGILPPAYFPMAPAMIWVNFSLALIVLMLSLDAVMRTLMDAVAMARREIEERQRAEEKMRHVQKLESLGVLAGGIAHDFNNLLVGVLGNVDLALRRTPPDAEVRPRLEQVEAAARRGAELCRELLAYSGHSRRVVAPLDLSCVVREMAHILQVSISKSARLQLSLGDAVPLVEADGAQLRQVVMNLIMNASDALGDRNGVITVTTGTRLWPGGPMAGGVLSGDLPSGNVAFLEVGDTGCGMDAATRERIFDPFLTTKFAGRGLGLAAVLGIARSHRWALVVDSAPGQGASFKVIFPPAADQTRLLPLDQSPPRPCPVGRGTVLVVDDEPAVREVAEEMLGELGFDALTAQDGVGALDVLKARGGSLACVILDLTMPRMGGAETLRELRALYPALPVIVSSGYDEGDVSQRLADRGAAAFIQKPFDTDALQRTLTEALVRALPEQAL
jgi:signal transduction histidine kinase/ActR/RegA family two-component response regulator